MSLLPPIKSLAGTLEYVKGARVSKATDHSKWHRQKQRNGLSTSSPSRTQTVEKPNGIHLKGVQQEDKVAPKLKSPQAENGFDIEQLADKKHHQQDFNAVAAASLQKLMSSPISFQPATSLTLKDEQRGKLNKHQPRKVLSDEHRLRRQRTSIISKSWPRIQKSGLPNAQSDAKSKPLGLDNPHNFCYRRSVLQAFLHLPALYNWLQEIQETHRRVGTHDDQTRCLACDFSYLAKAIWSRSRKNAQARLRAFDQAVRALGPKQKQYSWLMNTSQADAHEFMLFVVDVYQDLLKLPAPVVKGLFKLQVLSQWTCDDCKTLHTANPVDETGISVSLRKDKGTLRDYVRGYFHDTVEEARCENALCQSKKNRTRTRTINAAPEVLFVQLARFEQHYDKRSGKFRASKDSKPVPFEQFLDFSEYAVQPELREKGNLKYKLSSVVAHAGSLHGGHYIAFAEGPSGYMEFNDDLVREVTLQKMLNPGGGFTPYILTYIACEGRE